MSGADNNAAIMQAMIANKAHQQVQDIGSSMQSNGVTTDQALGGVMNSVLNLEGKGVGSLVKEGLDKSGGALAFGKALTGTKGLAEHGAALSFNGVTPPTLPPVTAGGSIGGFGFSGGKGR
ncbi:MAG: hypothetical protein K0R63_350 [Rickettsiales bacterium]|jgi:hypothetical protein|nr:hypothetical protein [Rickettsiales bacterium]